jgi:hypothetical protein
VFETTMDIVVRRTPTQAFDHVARGFFEHHGLWDSTVTSMQKTSEGPVGLGTTGLEERRFGRSLVKSEIQVTAFEPDRRFGYATTSGPMRQQAEIAIEEHDGGARLRVHIRLVPASLSTRVLEPLFRPTVARNIRDHVERMRIAIDAEPTEPTGGPRTA